MTGFDPFDPLSYKKSAESEVAALGLKREIREILNSYVGWYDPFCELIQNSLDSLDHRRKSETDSYVARLNIVIDIQNQRLTVSDNGTGLTKQQFNQFLVPFFSFKSGKTRGHKGVGATYLAYGFNFIQVCTRTEEFQACGKMTGAKNWLNDDNPSGNPQMEHDTTGPVDTEFASFDRGVSITVKVDSSTHPKDLGWIGATDPASWLKILMIKTGLGAIVNKDNLKLKILVIDGNGLPQPAESETIEYLYPHNFFNVVRKMNIRELWRRVENHYKSKGYEARIPSSLSNFDCLFDIFQGDELATIIQLDLVEAEIIERYQPTIYCGFAYSVKVFHDFNTSLGLRANYEIITGGFQIASNNMPQGEIYQIPLQRYIGRQNQIHFVIHFNNCNADLGRKGYNKDVMDFCKSVTAKIVTKYLNKFKPYLRQSTGTPSDLVRINKVADWKEEMKSYERENPLTLTNERFFLPTKKISITSKPSREQDVIALFNQLVAGGVIRGIRIMATDERFTYDGLYRIIIEYPTENHLFDKQNNPLGILKDSIDEHTNLPFYSQPWILEYKYSLDGLIEDIEDETKNSNDIGLVVVWSTGERYKGNFHITSLIDEDNLSLRQYHGVTHMVTNLTTGQKEMDLIVLSELIDYLNHPQDTIASQKIKYEGD